MHREFLLAHLNEYFRDFFDNIILGTTNMIFINQSINQFISSLKKFLHNLDFFVIHFKYDKEFHKTKRCPGVYPQTVQKDTEEAPNKNCQYAF